MWPLLDVVDAHLGDPWLSSLSTHLHWGRPGAPADESEGAGRRFSSVRHIADLFDRYGVHRPGMLRAWAGGDDTDGDGAPLPDGVRWQAELWRRVRARVGAPSPAERLEDACRLLREQPGVLGLPERLSLFGLTRLPASYLDVLEAIADHREVHLFLLHPSPALWERARPFARSAWSGLRADDRSADMPLNPLLGTWGRDAREMQLVLGARAGVDDHRPLDEAAGSLLGRLQAGVRADLPPPGAPLDGRLDERVPLDPADRSLEIHACHGRGRQVEVVRDAILHALADDPTLEPRDVLVMCPDVESFAPLVQATFAEEGSEEEDAERTPDIRVRLADRSLRQTNPLLGVVAELLDLASARLTAAQVLDLAARDPVRRRFGLDDDDLARLDRWAAECGVRWGLDAAHRSAYGLEAIEANTWRSGLDRLLAGVAMAEEDGRLVGGVLPLDDVDSGSIDLTGRLAEFVERLGAEVDALSTPRPVARLGADGARGRRRALRGHGVGRLAARAARSHPRRRVHRGLGGRPGLHPLPHRDPGAPGRSPARASHPGELPHRPPDRLHAGADALGAPPGDLPDGPRRRRLPPPRRPRRRRHPGPRPAGGGSQRARRGPPAAAGRADGRHRSPGDRLLGPRRAHQRAPAARRAGGRAARRDRRHGARRGGIGQGPGRGAAPAPALRRPELHRRRARPAWAVGLRPGGPRRGPGARDGHRPGPAVPGAAPSGPRRRPGLARAAGALRGASGAGLPARAARGDALRRARGRGRVHPDRAGRPPAVGDRGAVRAGEAPRRQRRGRARGGAGARHPSSRCARAAHPERDRGPGAPGRRRRGGPLVRRPGALARARDRPRPTVAPWSG